MIAYKKLGVGYATKSMLKCILVASVAAVAVQSSIYSPSLGNWRFYGGFGSLQGKSIGFL